MEVELLWSLSLHLAHTPFSKLLPAVLYTVVEKWMSDMVFWECLWVMTVLEQANALSLVFALPPHTVYLIIFQSSARPHTKTLWIECRGGLAVYHKAYFCSIYELDLRVMYTSANVYFMNEICFWMKQAIFVCFEMDLVIYTGVQKLESS